MEKLGFNYKVWLEAQGEKVFGDGPCDILQRVDRSGSLRQAAVEINMSYSQAWRLVRSLEKGLGFTLLIKKTGGEKGGGSLLTAEARELMQCYLSFRRAAQGALQGVFNEHFGTTSTQKPAVRMNRIQQSAVSSQNDTEDSS